METEETDNHYRHTDLYACAFMLLNGVNVLATEQKEVKGRNWYGEEETKIISTFIMDCDNEVGEEMFKRYQRNEKVGIISYKQALRTAKDILFSDKDIMRKR